MLHTLSLPEDLPGVEQLVLCSSFSSSACLKDAELYEEDLLDAPKCKSCIW